VPRTGDGDVDVNQLLHDSRDVTCGIHAVKRDRLQATHGSRGDLDLATRRSIMHSIH
jgi:hypothetical protein